MDVDAGTSTTDVQMMMKSDADGTKRDRHHDDVTDNHDTTHHDDDGTDNHDAANHDNDCTNRDDRANNHDDGASGANHDDDGTNHDDVTNHDDDGDKLDRPFIYTGFDSEDVWFEWIPSLKIYIKRFWRKWLDQATFILWSLEDCSVEGTTSRQRQCNLLKQDWAWSKSPILL
jgi:hypothetical protein